MNQSLALLYKDPMLAEELHSDIRKLICSISRFAGINCPFWSMIFGSTHAEELVKSERGDISELMTTSFSETRTTEELLPAESEEEKDDEEEEERAFQNRPYPPRIGTLSAITHAHPHMKSVRHVNNVFVLLWLQKCSLIRKVSSLPDWNSFFL